MKKGAFILAAVGLAISACARAPAPTIQSKLDALKGHPAKEVIDKLGNPDARTSSDGRTTYVWSAPSYYPPMANCTLKVFVDNGDKVTDYDFNGSVGGCGHFAHLLDSSFHEPQDALKPW